MIPGASQLFPANGPKVETAGIEPARRSHRIPLWRHGKIAAYALIDAEDAHLADERWCLRPKDRKLYAERSNGAQPRLLHRVVLGLGTGDGRSVDHINGDGLDNRRANLRVATTAENAQNQGSRGGSSTYRGVTWDRARGKWMARAMLDGRHKTIGRFDSELEAAEAAAAFRREHMPFSAEALAGGGALVGADAPASSPATTAQGSPLA
jgi:hypothetical protein